MRRPKPVHAGAVLLLLLELVGEELAALQLLDVGTEVLLRILRELVELAVLEVLGAVDRWREPERNLIANPHLSIHGVHAVVELGDVCRRRSFRLVLADLLAGDQRSHDHEQADYLEPELPFPAFSLHELTTVEDGANQRNGDCYQCPDKHHRSPPWKEFRNETTFNIYIYREFVKSLIFFKKLHT